MKRYFPLFLIILSLAIMYFYVRPEYYTIQDTRAASLQYDDLIAKAAETDKLSEHLPIVQAAHEYILVK